MKTKTPRFPTPTPFDVTIKQPSAQLKKTRARQKAEDERIAKISARKRSSGDWPSSTSTYWENPTLDTFEDLNIRYQSTLD